MTDTLNFGLFYSGDGYSTAGKVMGRQSAGSGFVKGIARRWPDGAVTAVGADRVAARQMRSQLAASGHRGAVRWHDLSSDAAPNPAAVYYPAPPEITLAHARNRFGMASYSLFGVTHTLSSAGAMDQVARLVCRDREQPRAESTLRVELLGRLVNL